MLFRSPAATVEPAVTVGEPVTPVEVADLWPAVIEQIKGSNAMLAHALADATPVGASDRELVLAFPAGAEFNKRKAEQDEHRRMVADAVRTLSGQGLVPRYELRDIAAPAPPTLSDDEVVQHFIEEFDAEEIDE